MGAEFQSTSIDLAPVPKHWTAEGEVGKGAGPVTQAMLNDPFAATDRWLHYYGNYAGHRHSPLRSLNPRAVPDLEVAWTLASGTTGQFEVSPIVYDGVMYVTTSYNRLFALDAVSGDILWRYDHQQPDDLRLCCGPPNRGVAIVGDLVLMGTLDAKLIAFERRTGKIAWQATVAPYRDGFSLTSAPLVVRNLAIVGIAGGEYGVRGFFDAYDVKSGERIWRHYTVPAAGEEGAESWAGNSNETGGAPAWTTGAYDPATDTLYWTTGNPSPDWNGDLRQGDNLFSNAILALDPATGKRRWHFQTTPHDVWDYDGNTQLLLIDTGDEKLLAQPNRNGFFYFLNRPDGAFRRASQYVEQLNWATIDAAGRPVVNPNAWPVEKPTERICPSNMGGINGAFSAAYNPELGLAFVPSIEACQRFAKGVVVFSKGLPFLAGLPETLDADEGKSYGLLSAIDVETGEAVWRYRDRYPMMGGTLSTAGGVVFTGNLTGDALAFNAKTGDELWRFRVGGGVRSQPVAYEIDGTSYVAIAAGSWNTLDAFSGGPSKIPEGGHLFVFKLPKD
jgi:alcohol dehydrogenase (cytochrome c)